MIKINKEKESLLPQELLKELLRYEYETGLFYWVKKTSNYSRVKVGQIAGTVNNEGYVVIKINGRDYKAHRLVWLYVHGYFPEGVNCQIDHIDRNKTNNAFGNLRVTSNIENSRNKRMNSNNTSGVTGVSLRVKTINGVSYETYVAFWQDKNGATQFEPFSVLKYGKDRAKALAVDYRKEQIRLLEVNFGIKYTEQHGTK